ncbi:MAG: T9SS type A sorting domain-containing protein, partial [Bacteroidota bacterium]
VDCAEPTAVCDQGIAVSLSSATGSITLFPSDFDEGSSDNCATDVHLSFSQDINDTTLEVDCSDVGESIIVEIWVTDEAGNQNVCWSLLVVSPPPGGCCTGTVDYSGSVLVDTGDPLEDVEVTISNASGSTSQTTQEDGLFAFDDLNCEEASTITAFRDTGDPNDITVLDLVKLRSHILFIDILPSLRVAALDINNSGGVSTLDLVFLSELVLQLPSAQDNGYFFTPEDYSFSGISGSIDDVDFTAVRYGNAVYEFEVPEATEQTTFYFPSGYEVDPYFPVIEIPILVENFNDVVGFQFEFSWNPDFLAFNSLDFLNVPAGIGAQVYADTDNPGNARIYLFSENPNEGLTINDGDPVAFIQFDLLSPFYGEIVLEFPENGYPAQVVYAPDCAVNQPITTGGSIIDTPIASTEEIETNSTWQVVPNLLVQGESILLQARESTKAPITVEAFHSSGQLIHQEQIAPQSTSWTIGTQDWPAGVYWLSLRTEGQLMQTSKVIIQN